MEFNPYPAAVVTARRMRPMGHADFDDLVQEGAIAAWLATKDRELRDPKVYGAVSGNRRIYGLVSGRNPMLGSERPGERITDVSRKTALREDLAEDFDAPAPAEPEIELCEVVRDAVAELEREEDRAAVWLMYWQDLTRQEAADRLGISRIALNRRWQERIAPQLRNSLTIALG